MKKKNDSHIHHVILKSELGNATLKITHPNKKVASAQAKEFNTFFKKLDSYDLFRAHVVNNE